ncbi:hypothetical protein BDV96DRAFT_685409 [Lophiotrema nucula]|uniref:Uncharacterized protein n=1 Tax=Lophiotrema nucula TaxID=690887 RepID=A0A6A5ZFM0_9PLEO|nr:hypothetical protein BDV96DRAFT_685409 [Lophiotrema nucula]
MQYSLIFVLAATGALAAPAKRQYTGQLSVLLLAIASTEEIREVTLEIPADVANQEQRCSVFNSDGLVIQVKRGDTVTTSFGIGEKWFPDGNADGEVANPSSNEPFKPPSLGSDELIIGKIVCNPTSEEIDEEEDPESTQSYEPEVPVEDEVLPSPTAVTGLGALNLRPSAACLSYSTRLSSRTLSKRQSVSR